MGEPISLVEWPPGAGQNGTSGPLITNEQPAEATIGVQIAYGILSILAFALADEAEDLGDEALSSAQAIADRVCEIERIRADKYINSQGINQGLIDQLLTAQATVFSCSSTQNLINGCMSGLRACLRNGARRQADRYGVIDLDSCDRSIELETISSANDGIQQMIRHNDWRRHTLSAFSAEQAARAQNSATASSRSSNANNLLNLAISNYNAIYQVASGAVGAFVGIGSAALGNLAQTFQ